MTSTLPFLTWIYFLLSSLAVTESPHGAPWAMHYVEVAQAIEVAAKESPLPGEDGERKMGAVLTAIAFHESRFNPNAKGDKGQSVGPWQLSRWWKAPADVQGQARVAASIVQTSFRLCATRPLEEKLAFYAAGGNGCREEGYGKSRTRMRLAGKLRRLEVGGKL